MRPSEAQSHLRYPLTRLLGNGGNVRVLRALFTYGAPLSAAQLARDTGLTPQGTRRVLDGLAGQGIVSALGQGRANLFTIDAAHPLSTPLRMLFAEEQSTWNALMQRLREILQSQKAVKAAWLYGSVARGNDEPASDVDVALVTEGVAGRVAQAVRDSLRSLEDDAHVSFSVVALSTMEVLERADGDAWWRELVRDAKPLKGGAPEQVAARLRREALHT